MLKVAIFRWTPFGMTVHFQFGRMDRLPVKDYSFRWAEIVTGLKFEKTICWLCSPDCINLCQNLISCLEHFPFKSFRQELSNINLQVYLRRAHNAYFRTRYVARPFFGKHHRTAVNGPLRQSTSLDQPLVYGSLFEALHFGTPELGETFYIGRYPKVL